MKTVDGNIFDKIKKDNKKENKSIKTSFKEGLKVASPGYYAYTKLKKLLKR